MYDEVDDPHEVVLVEDAVEEGMSDQASQVRLPEIAPEFTGSSESAENDLYEFALDLLMNALGPSSLRQGDIEQLAREIMAQPIPSNLDARVEIRTRLTALKKDGCLAQWKSQRQGRGRTISVEAWNSVSEDECDPSTTDSTEDILSRFSLSSSKSALNEVISRAHEKARDDLDHVLAQVTPANRNVLLRILPRVEQRQSVRDLARQVEKDPTQVARAFRDAREVLAGRARRIKWPAVLRCHDFNYKPQGVPWELVMETHKGPVIPLIGVDQRTKQASRRGVKQPDTRPEIERLPRPRERRYVQHAVFGRAIVLRDRESDSHGRIYDLAFDDGVRRTILAEHVQAGQ